MLASCTCDLSALPLPTTDCLIYLLLNIQQQVNQKPLQLLWQRLMLDPILMQMLGF
jgi:hypothetical protein